MTVPTHDICAGSPESVFERCSWFYALCRDLLFTDHTDEIAATMLAQLLEQRGHKTMLLHSITLTNEILERLGEESSTTIYISALPPFAFVHARNLCQKIRYQLPENRILIGLWGATGDGETLGERFGAARPDAVATTLMQAIRLVRDCDPITEAISRSRTTEGLRKAVVTKR